MKIAVFGLAITSSWGNGHAVTWRSLLRGAHALGHEITFYERDQPWYARHRDLTAPEYCRVRLQPDLRQALADVRREAKEADCVIVGSYVQDGPLILRELLAGALYAPYKGWPPWLQHMEHLAPEQHREFYCQSRWTLNLTREAMTRAGYSPSVRLFEAAACATPIISDRFPGLETLFQPDEEILIADTAGQIMRILTEYSPEECRRIGDAAAERVRERDCGKARAAELMRYCEAARRPSSAAA